MKIQCENSVRRLSFFFRLLDIKTAWINHCLLSLSKLLFCCRNFLTSFLNNLKLLTFSVANWAENAGKCEERVIFGKLAGKAGKE